MTSRARFSRLPEQIKEDLFEEYGSPSDFAEKHAGCDEHQKDLFRSGPNIGFFCEVCGQSLGEKMWISPDKVDDQDYEDARTDRGEIKENYRKTLKDAEERHWDRLAEIGERRANNIYDDMPPKDANGTQWNDYFRGLPKYSYEWKKAYEVYTESEWWESRRDRVLDAKGRTCRLQYKGCNGHATQAHHKSYDLIGFEPLHHLVPACKRCHDRLHDFKDQKAHA